MKTYLLKAGVRQAIAKAGETDIAVAYNAKTWVDEYPAGNPQLMVTTPGGKLVPVTVETVDNLITGQVPNELLAGPGVYSYVFVWTSGSTQLESGRCECLVLGSSLAKDLTHDSRRTPDWAERIFLAAEVIEGAVNGAMEARNTAADMAAQAAESEANAAGSAEDAETSANLADQKATEAKASAEDAAASATAMHPENYVAQAFSASSAYSAGTYVMHDGYLYRLTADHDADVTWENTAKTQVKVADDVGDLKNASDVMKASLMDGTIPYAVNGTITGITQNGGISAVQDGNTIVLNGTSTASAAQGWTKISLSDPFIAWRAATTPSEWNASRPVKYSAGHTYRVAAQKVSGTFGGKIRVTGWDENVQPVHTAIDMLTEDNDGSVEFTPETDVSANYLLYAETGTSFTDAVLRVEIIDITDKLTFDSIPTANSTNPVTSGGVYQENSEDRIIAKLNDDNLSNDTFGVSGLRTVIFQSGKHRNSTDGDIYPDPIPDPDYVCAKVYCSPRDRLTIKGNGGSGIYRLWCAYAADGTYVDQSDKDIIGGETLEVNNNAAYYWINILKSSPEIYATVQALQSGYGIPNYYNDNDYLQNRINRITEIQNIMSVNNDAFWLLSDYHYRNNEGHSQKILKHLSKKTGIRRLHFDGDSGGSEGTADITLRYKALQNSANIWGQLEECVPEMYGVLGNHEWISSSVFGMSAMMGAYLNRYKATIPSMEPTCGSYWIDNTANKIRYFFLQNTNVGSHPVAPTVLWFGEQLRQVPEDYSVAVMIHHGYIPSAYTASEYGITVNYTADDMAISQLLMNWKKKQNWTYSGHEYVFNTGTVNRSVIGVFCAHMHHSTLYNGADAWALDSETAGITVFRASEDALNENTIAINKHPWFWWYNETTGEYEQKERTPGTIYEQCFYCIQIDLDNKHLYITAIGGDRDWDCVYESSEDDS